MDRWANDLRLQLRLEGCCTALCWPGEIPAQMLADMGIKWVVLGHSERRENCGETSQIASHPVSFIAQPSSPSKIRSR